MSIESKVGLFVVLGIVSLLILSTRIQTVSNIGKEGYSVYVDVKNASGLEKNAKVKINGVDIGYIDSIFLENGKAKLKLFIFDGNRITSNSIVLIAQESLLGGKYIDISYGDANTFLDDGDTISKYKSYASIDETSQKIYEAAEEFKKLMKNFNEALNPETVKEFQQAIKNFRVMAEKISATADEFKVTGETVNEKLPEIMKRIDSLTAEFDKAGATVKRKLPKLMNEFTAVAEDIRGLVKENEVDLNNAIVSAGGFFRSGKTTFDEIGNIVSKVEKAELSIGLRAERLLDDSLTKTYFSGAYRPNPSSYYMFDIVSADKINETDPLTGDAILPETHDGGDSFVSAQMGKRYDNLLIRGGIIENTGGVGMDYFINADRIKTSFDLYDFNAVNDIRGNSPHAKFSLRYSPIKHINFFTGYDNFLNDESANVFIGAGVEFVDDDLRDLVISTGAAGSMAGN